MGPKGESSGESISMLKKRGGLNRKGHKSTNLADWRKEI